MKNLDDIMQDELPINVREVFYSATILPNLISNSDFKYSNKFLDLINGLPSDLKLIYQQGKSNFVMSPEYSLKTSISNGRVEEGRFVNKINSKDTPDIIIQIIYPIKYLIVVECKMFDNPTKDKMVRQLREQRRNIIDEIGNELNISKENIYHILVIPKKLAVSRKIFDDELYQVLYWETIIEAYNELLNGNYYFDVLNIALNKYDELVSKNKRREYDDVLTGLEIIKNYSEIPCVINCEEIEIIKRMSENNILAEVKKTILTSYKYNNGNYMLKSELSSERKSEIKLAFKILQEIGQKQFLRYRDCWIGRSEECFKSDLSTGQWTFFPYPISFKNKESEKRWIRVEDFIRRIVSLTQ